jgi:hypothetical protein
VGSPAKGIHTALYARLTGDVTLMALVAGIFDHVPDGQAYPYVTIRGGSEVPDDTHTDDGRETVPLLTVWSQYRGSKQLYEIGDRIVTLLHDYPLEVTGWRTVRLSLDLMESPLDDPDGVTRSLPIHFRVLTQRP